MSWRAAFFRSLTDWPFWAAVGISLAAAALRIAPLREGLWLDELHTAWCAVGSLKEVAERAAIGNQGPLFFWLEWLLIGLFGPSELALRLPSFLAGSMLPMAVYFFARRLGTAGMGVLAAALVAVDPLGIFYSSEARPYALVQLLAVVHLAIAAEMVRKPSWQARAGWIASAAVLFYLHYTTALLLAAEIVFYALIMLLRPRWVAYRWTSAVMDLAIVAAVCLPVVGRL